MQLTPEAVRVCVCTHVCMYSTLFVYRRALAAQERHMAHATHT